MQLFKVKGQEVLKLLLSSAIFAIAKGGRQREKTEPETQAERRGEGGTVFHLTKVSPGVSTHRSTSAPQISNTGIGKGQGTLHIAACAYAAIHIV